MFEERFEIYKNTVDKGLQNFLVRLECEESIVISKALKYSLLGGGKLLRPVLTLAICDMFEKNFKKALPFACAVEFIHVGSLVHDDLPCMDDDIIRRGRDSCHVKYGEAAAVLVGDLLFSSAFEILSYGAEYGLTEKEIVKAVSFLSKMFGASGIITGQDLDIYLKQQYLSEEKIEVVAKYKTASLFRAACRLGAIAAGADLGDIEIIDRYATYFGVCFQILDDISDFSKNKKTERENFVNFVFVYGRERAIQLANKYKEKALDCLSKLEENKFLVEFTNRVLSLNV